MFTAPTLVSEEDLRKDRLKHQDAEQLWKAIQDTVAGIMIKLRRIVSGSVLEAVSDEVLPPWDEVGRTVAVLRWIWSWFSLKVLDN